MDKLQEISYMARVGSVCESNKKGCQKCLKKGEYCVHYHRAEKIYNAGYRNIDDIRKELEIEIAREMATKLANASFDLAKDTRAFSFKVIDLKDALKFLGDYGIDKK